MTKSKIEMPRARTRTDAYLGAGNEPPLAEVLAEPIVRAVMERDSVSEATLINVIENARHAIERHAA